MSERKAGLKDEITEAALIGDHFHRKLSAAFAKGDYSHPEHEWLLRARSASEDAMAFLRCAEHLHDANV